MKKTLRILLALVVALPLTIYTARVSIKLLGVIALMAASVVVSTGIEKGATNFRAPVVVHKASCNLHWILMSFYAFAVSDLQPASQFRNYFYVMIPISAILYGAAAVVTHRLLSATTPAYFTTTDEKTNLLIALFALAAALFLIHLCGVNI